MNPAISSLYQAVPLTQEIPPLIIGERTNSNGSKKFRGRLLRDDYEGCLEIALEQEKKGAHALDLCVAYAGRDEKRDMTELVKRFARSVKIPLVIDSTDPDVIEEALRLYPGRCVVNSINLEDGEPKLNRICRLVKRYGAAVIGLTIHEDGMAMTVADKVTTAKRIVDLAVNGHGLRPWDILIDPLTFTIGSGDETLNDAAARTLDAISGIKRTIPDVLTVLGLSNVSFGLRPNARKILNSVFLNEAVAAGLDAAIVDSGKILPMAQVSEEDRTLCLDLIYDRRKKDEEPPLTRFIDHYEIASETDESADKPSVEPPEQTLQRNLLEGSRKDLVDILEILLKRYTPVRIINEILIPGMKTVGELFGRGEILLPFVLKSAEVMKTAVAYLEPLMASADVSERVRILLATVQGDVHDIGKNLVDIILSNNGYKVFNIGIKMPAETIIEKCREVNADVIGLSGLLVKSAIVMQQSMAQYQAAELGVPILLGGAALTRPFVAESCVPGYNAPVVYCKDAFAGLAAVRAFEAGTLKSTVCEDAVVKVPRSTGAVDVNIVRDNPVPKPPFLGFRHVREIDGSKIFPYINEQALFRGRWGYRRGKMGRPEYDALIAEKVRPAYDVLKARVMDGGLADFGVTYGYFRCFSRGDGLVIRDGAAEYTLDFPRQADSPHLCIADFFKPDTDGGDMVGFFVVTVGARISDAAKELYEQDAYHDYLMMHGFGVELADALAEYWHEIMREELGINREKPGSQTGYVTQGYQGSRYGFGYPACPDMGAHDVVFKLLDPGGIGITLTESMEMVPEMTTSAIVVHHPGAKYFSV